MTFGDYIKARRAALGLTQPEAAARAHIEQSYLSKLENGKSTPSSDVYTRLAAAYGIESGDLVDAVSADALDKLRDIKQVRTQILQRRTLARSHARRWWLAGLAAFILSGGCFGIVQIGQAERSTFIYQSSGIILPGESLDVFAEIQPELEPGAPGFTEALTRRNALIERLDEEFTARTAYSGPSFVEAAPGGRRVWRLVGNQSTPRAMSSIWFLAPAFAFLFGGLACLAVSWRPERFDMALRAPTGN